MLALVQIFARKNSVLWLDTDIVNLHKNYLEMYLNFAIFVIVMFHFNGSVY